MSNEMIINGIPVKIIEWNGQRVITTQEMAIHHEMPTFRLNEKFRRNKKYFKENKDYFVLTKDIIAKCDNDIKSLLYHESGELYLFTESGYLNFVKTINDDKAWEIYGQLIEAYFLVKRLNNAEKIFLENNKENRKGLAGEWKEHESKNYGALTITEYESLFNNTEIRKKQMNDKQLSLLSAFEFLETRKLENNPDIKGDNKLSDSLKDTGNKINEIINAQIKII
jgi:hypothetical protein